MTETGQKIRTIDSLWTFFVALAFLGPLALPLLWRNPRFRTRTKILGSLAVIAFTLFLLWFSAEMLRSFNSQLEALQQLQ